MSKALEKLIEERDKIQEKRKDLDKKEKAINERIASMEAQEITAFMKAQKLTLEQLAKIVKDHQLSWSVVQQQNKADTA